MLFGFRQPALFLNAGMMLLNAGMKQLFMPVFMAVLVAGG
jgi:hypothetical protein